MEAAARAARLRGTGLSVVHAFVWPLLKVAPRLRRTTRPSGASGSRPRASSARLWPGPGPGPARLAPDIDVAAELVAGEPLTVLTTRSRSAALVVVGSRGAGAFTGLLLGSVAVPLAAHAACPVLVVRGRERASGPVLPTVDGSADSEAAVDLAFAEAAARGVELRAVHAWAPTRDRPISRRSSTARRRSGARSSGFSTRRSRPRPRVARSCPSSVDSSGAGTGPSCSRRARTRSSW
ncbi:universal stress protein [Streptomyces sp. NBC_00233]|uniref:universal stress protein n=1 Tax=Streptomyces sp. NBC_00233 TaxID=2975686 RepID=UPI0022565E8C|nr:universal stress protein [Streptomyces sp. NBC_00233]MCX5231013.1 universal stress protein [Streptomyces sp. NBC_00233]